MPTAPRPTAITAALVTAAALAANAAAQTWTNPVPLTTPGEDDSFLPPSVEPDGSIRVINTNIESGDYTLRDIRFDPDTNQWLPPLTVATGNDIIGAADDLYEDNGDITVIYRDTIGLTDQLVEVRYLDASDTWTAPRVIFTQTRTDSFDPPSFEALELAEDNNGNVLAVINDFDPNTLGRNLSVLLRNPATDQWSTPAPIVTGNNAVIPTLAQNDDGSSIHLLYALTAGAPAIRHRPWNPDSQSFGPETVIPGTSPVFFDFVGPSSRIVEQVDSQGRLTILWDSNPNSPSVRASTLDNGTWTSTVDLIPPFDDNDFAVTSFGDLALAPDDDLRLAVSRSESTTGNPLVVFYSLRFDADTAQWGEPQTVAEIPAFSTSRSRVAFTGNDEQAVMTIADFVIPASSRRTTESRFFDGSSWSDTIQIPDDDIAFLQETARLPDGRAVLILEESSSQPDAGIKATFFDPPATTPCPGDTNDDNTVDLADLLTVLANFGNAVPGGPTNGDFDNNGTVDLTDLLLVLANFGTTCP